MKASPSNPIYSVYVTSGGAKYNLTSVLISLDIAESKKQIAKSATISVTNIMVGNKWLTGILRVRDRVQIYANDGSGNKEVFRGIIWRRDYKSSLMDRELTFKCYDHLIYLQESEISEYFAEGQSTKDIISSIASKWGVKVVYEYESITHSKLVLRGTLSDVLTSDILDLVKDRTGKDYVILSDQDTMYIREVGKNDTVYRFLRGSNAISTTSKITMEGMITQVVIMGTADKDDRKPVQSTIVDNTDTYGTLQKIIDRNKETTLEEAEQEALNILKENSEPFKEYELTATDIPSLRKGDKVYCNAGDIANMYLIVTDVDRTISSRGKKMILTMREA